MTTYSDIDYALQLVAVDRQKASQQAGYQVATLTDDEVEQAHRWSDGLALKGITNTDGYEIIIGKLDKYNIEYTDVAKRTDRTNKDAIWANMIFAQAVTTIVERLKNDIAADLEAADETPEIVKQMHRQANRVSPNIKS